MKLLQVKPQIFMFETFNEFANEFALGADDLLVTHKFLFEDYMASTNIVCDRIFQEEYGAGEPEDEMIDRMFSDLKRPDYKRIIAIGGGTVIDIGKIFALERAPKTSMLFDKTYPARKRCELVIVPTTSGTGSEMTNISIANIKAKSTKLGLASDELFADAAVLIPQLVKELPYKFFIFSAIDALVHAVESYVSPKANILTETLSLKACELILKGFCGIITNGENHRKEKAADFLLASCIAGIAFGNAGVGAVHALAYPLGGKYHVPHGETNYQFFVSIFEMYQREKGGEKLDILAELITKELQFIGMSCEKEHAFARLGDMLGKLMPLKLLREYGMSENEIESFAQNVIDNQQRLLVNSYIPFTTEKAQEIYRLRY